MECRGGAFGATECAWRNGARAASALMIYHYSAAKLTVDSGGTPGAKWNKAAAKPNLTSCK
jgi:hypothetical protein